MGSIVNPKPILPNINFDTHTVGFVSRGNQPTGGYRIEVQSVENVDGELTVTIQTEDPCEGCMVTQGETQPYHLFQMPKTDDVEEPTAVFEIVTHNVEPSKLYPMFILSYEGETIEDPYDIKKILQELDEVDDVQI